MQQLGPCKYKIIYEVGDVKFDVPDLSYEELKQIQQKKRQARQWSRKIIDDWLKGKIEDISEFINLNR